MITLVTGTPGAGKTLFTVAELLSKQYRDRPIFTVGIPELALPHTDMPPISEWTIHQEVVGWQEGAARSAPVYAFPQDSVIVIDEAQNVFRPRPAGSKVPDYVAALETHRHGGIDFVLITQHPSRIDNAVRTLVGRHIHIRRIWGWNRAIIHEWDSATDPARTATSVKKGWSYPKKAFQLYKSATVHQERGNKVPFMFWFTLGLLVALPPVGYFAYKAIMKVTHGETIKDSKISDLQKQLSDSKNPPLVSSSLTPSKSPSVVWNDLDKYPRTPNAPESAPLYDDYRKVVAMPSVSGCISSQKACRCYDQRGFEVVPTTSSFCADWIASGGHFNPYIPDTSSSSTASNSLPEISQNLSKGASPGREAGDTVNLVSAPDFALN
jgi:zona occludens toxin